jgi:uncharacterized protein (DUF1697 family)
MSVVDAYNVAMTTFVALLRGVNVGKARRLPMADFRAVLSGLGYTNVSTLLNSGNAVFRAASGTPARLSADIAAAISARLKVEAPVIVKTAGELAAVISENPLRVADDLHSRYLVAFVQDAKALSRLAVMESLVIPPERFAIGKGAAYLLCPAGILESKAWQALVGNAGKPATTRNWATVLKLHALANGVQASRS